MTLELLEKIAKEAESQNKIDSVMDAFWTIFSWTGGLRWVNINTQDINVRFVETKSMGTIS